ncbi:MAG: hypothetical protein COB16_04450 [Rhodobacteraceae bacterium]|nr:MAG: hypothetical protein COB16_04450 [Paracoccaceae bacterium]
MAPVRAFKNKDFKVNSSALQICAEPRPNRGKFRRGFAVDGRGVVQDTPDSSATEGATTSVVPICEV